MIGSSILMTIDVSGRWLLVKEDVTYSYNRLCHSTTSNTLFYLMFGLSIKELMANKQMDFILLTVNNSNSD